MRLNVKVVGFFLFFIFYRSSDGPDHPILIVSNDWGRIELR
jgi:hypothetical protein